MLLATAQIPVFNRRNTPGSSSTPSSTSSSEVSRRMINLDELYDATQVIEETTLFCLFTNSDPLSFNGVVTKEKWIETIWMKKYMPLKRMIPRT